MERELIDMPQEMAHLPRNEKGYPIPCFVAEIDGKPDFRVVKPGWIQRAYMERLCWLCGGKLGSRQWVVMGPMCTVTRTTSEPGCHRLCAQFAVKNCPFMTKPMAKRRTDGLPEDAHDPAGIHLDRNPGVSAIYECSEIKAFKAPGGVLFEVGKCKDLTYWREGRIATYDEVMESVESGLPHLLKLAEKEGPRAEIELRHTIREWVQMVETMGVFDDNRA